MIDNITKKPSIMIVLTFFCAVSIGTLLLSLPYSTYNGISIVDALFTSMSAVCVTGLSVQDTGTYFTFFGQCVILFLMQIGGLGILTFAAFFIGILKGSLGFKERYWLEESLTQQYISNFRNFLHHTFIFVIVVESIGAFLLFWVFYEDFPLKKSIFLAIFHSISAFCNAGFSLFSNSLESYKGSIALNTIIMLLIILGGIGFIVINDIKSLAYKSKRDISFHTKVVLTTSALLIVAGFFSILILENSHALKDMPVKDKILVSCFQSVTARTAGFNTIPFSSLCEASLLLVILLMFIGGSPGSMAGGVKTTSFALMVILLWSRMRGREHPEIFHKSISNNAVDRIVILILGSLCLVVACIFLLLIVESNTIYFKECRGSFLMIVFEAISAFATVGLSIGITPYLTILGKIIISFLMFIGRIGPLTLAVWMMESKQQLNYEYPEEEIMIG
ncbi:MAG: Trk family potassium uptake protein [Candidatus Brocadiae bacterium]|nr:Trk family potassium uptake protein [Candidatus Brocadiia bacterium]